MKNTLYHSGWRCSHLEDRDGGIPVSVPDDAMLREKRSPAADTGLNGAWFEGHDYRYTNTLEIPAEQLAWHHVLEFEGVYRKAEVWINGRQAGFRPYGYTNFYVDCDPFLKAGSNAIEVIARNADQPNSRWYSGAGIFRPVRHWTGPKEHIELNGVKVTTLSLEPARIAVDVKTAGPGTVTVQVLDGKRAVAQVSGPERRFTLELPDPAFWSPEHPALYTCRVTFGQDEAEEHFGLRTIAWGRDGFMINGRRVILRGACVHHDNGLLGAACLPDALERRIRLLRENGYNAIRSAHNPCSKTALEICDRLGVMALDEYADHWYIHKTKYDYVDDFQQYWRQDITDMVDKDYNHPCVIMYSSGNEVSETAQPRGIALAREMTELFHSLDSTRPVTCGINIFFNFLSSIGLGQYSDEKADREAARSAKAKGERKKERSVGSRFFNELASTFGAEFMKSGAALRGGDRTTREAYAVMDIAGYNYGEKRYVKDLKRYPDRLILGSETFCSDAFRFWELAKDNPRLIGDFVWAGTDYLGEAMIGSWEYSEYAKSFDAGFGWISAGSGRIDLTGKPLGEALYTRVAFELEKGPFLAVRPVCHESRKHSPSAWKMTNAMPSWSFRGWEGRNAIVEVYARAVSVELLLNGRSAGRKAMGQSCVFTFRVPYQNGVLEAVAYGPDGREAGRCSLKTTGEETILQAVPEEKAVKPGHLCFIRLQYTDLQGTVKPAERGLLDVSVTGGKLRGLGSACPYYELDYLGSRTDTYYGEALAIVEAGEGKEVTLTASDGKYSATAAVAVEGESGANGQ